MKLPAVRLPDQPTVIKVAAVVTAAPRWTAALLAAEGLRIPPEWWWWLPLSAFLSVGMAVVEGFAFSFVFEAWRNQTDTKADRLLWLAILSAALFIGVLAPNIAASVTGDSLAATLGGRIGAYLWGACVAASTIAIVVSVGYAQKATKGSGKPAQVAAQPAAQVAAQPADDQPQAQPAADPAPATPHVCAQCGAAYAKQQSLAAHMRAHGNGHTTNEEVTV